MHSMIQSLLPPLNGNKRHPCLEISEGERQIKFTFLLCFMLDRAAETLISFTDSEAWAWHRFSFHFLSTNPPKRQKQSGIHPHKLHSLCLCCVDLIFFSFLKENILDIVDKIHQKTETSSSSLNLDIRPSDQSSSIPSEGKLKNKLRYKNTKIKA